LFLDVRGCRDEILLRLKVIGLSFLDRCHLHIGLFRLKFSNNLAKILLSNKFVRKPFFDLAVVQASSDLGNRVAALGTADSLFASV
jgi:hypothetical protein